MSMKGKLVSITEKQSQKGNPYWVVEFKIDGFQYNYKGQTSINPREYLNLETEFKVMLGKEYVNQYNKTCRTKFIHFPNEQDYDLINDESGYGPNQNRQPQPKQQPQQPQQKQQQSAPQSGNTGPYSRKETDDAFAKVKIVFGAVEKTVNAQADLIMRLTSRVTDLEKILNIKPAKKDEYPPENPDGG